MLRRFDLISYVRGDVELVSPEIIQHDQLILSWILTGISTSIVLEVTSYKTSASVWQCLQRLYASGTQTQQLHLRLQLQLVRKGGTSMADYILKILVLKDALVATKEKLKESEVILIVLGGLSDEYEAFVTSLTLHAMIRVSRFQNLERY